MEKNILVSVVMITYKHETFIAQAINSILNQCGDFEIELIISDDCSPDNTSQIVTNLINKHPKSNNILYTKHPKNIGLMPNFAWALSQAKGKYIAICEGDDYWTDPLKLKLQTDFLESNPNYIGTFHKVKIVDQNSHTLGYQPNTKKNRTYSFNELIQGWLIPTGSLCFRNVISEISIGSYNQIISGDRLLTALLADKGDFFYNNSEMGAYRKHPGGISVWGQRLVIFKSNILLFTQLRNKLQKKRKKQLKIQTFYWRVRYIEELKSEKKKSKAFFEIIKLIFVITNKNQLKDLTKLILPNHISTLIKRKLFDRIC